MLTNIHKTQGKTVSFASHHTFYALTPFLPVLPVFLISRLFIILVPIPEKISL